MAALTTGPAKSQFIAIATAEGKGTWLRDAFDGSATPVRAPDGTEPDGWYRVELDPGGALKRSNALADSGSALADIFGIAVEHGLDPCFPDAVLAESEGLVRDPGIADPGLVDLRNLAFVTIDNEDSRDLDQAVFVEEQGSTLVVWYAIADAAWFVRPGSAVWNEAMKRGSTYYLPGLTIPMLPKALCEGIVSLNPAEDRRALVFRIELARDGRATDARILRGRIHSRAKLSYDAVQAHYDGDPCPTPDPQAERSLALLREAGERRLREAESRDVVRIRRTEVEVSVAGKRGLRFVAVSDDRNDTERYNEQISLLCNVEGARQLDRHAPAAAFLQPIFRVHAPPGPERLLQLGDLIGSLVDAHELSPDTWSWRPGGSESLANYLRRLPDHGPMVGLSRVLSRQAMLCGGGSGFSVHAAPHHGVGSDVYARYTAPMREMVGVFVHRETWQLQQGRGDPGTDDEALRDRVIEGANRSKRLQRKIVDRANRLVLDQLFEEDLGRPMEDRPRRMATVMGLSSKKAHALLEDPAIDLKIYFHHLAEAQMGRFRLGPDRTHAVGDGAGHRLRMGDQIQVVVGGKDTDRDRWRLLPVLS
jgi:ribonuclease R